MVLEGASDRGRVASESERATRKHRASHQLRLVPCGDGDGAESSALRAGRSRVFRLSARRSAAFILEAMAGEYPDLDACGQLRKRARWPGRNPRIHEIRPRGCLLRHLLDPALVRKWLACGSAPQHYTTTLYRPSDFRFDYSGPRDAEY